MLNDVYIWFYITSDRRKYRRIFSYQRTNGANIFSNSCLQKKIIAPHYSHKKAESRRSRIFFLQLVYNWGSSTDYFRLKLLMDSRGLQIVLKKLYTSDFLFSAENFSKQKNQVNITQYKIFRYIYI